MIKLFVRNDPERSCKAIDIVKRFIASYKFRKCLEDATKDIPEGQSNCFQAAVVLVNGLIILTEDTKNWFFVRGRNSRGEYFWVEFDGWAIDASNSQRDLYSGGIPILICDAAYYRRSYQFRVFKTFPVERIGDGVPKILLKTLKS